MCGIAGCLNLNRDQPVDTNALHAMTTALAHRGPDGEGFHVDGAVGLGHRRLAIIDLVGGRQPLSNESGTVWLICNGEIYNHIELRRDLATRHRFRTQSDSEVILHLYEERGLDCLEQLNGMFAFALWDARAERLVLARDRLGIKPLYWTLNDGTFSFASEIKALIAGGMVDPQRNEDALAEYLTFQFLLGDQTLFKGVYRLEPGTCLSLRPFDERRPTITRYWDISCEVDEAFDYDGGVRRVDMLLQDAVALRMRSDVPVGAYLSGGLDSSVVTSLAARQLDGASQLSVFSGAFDGGEAFDETRYARMVAEHSHAAYHEVRPDEHGFVRDLPRLIYALDEPAAGPGVYPQFAVSQLAAQHVKVCLGGQGGDELFGGYARYLAAYLEQCLKGAIHGTQHAGNFVVTWDEIAPNLPMLGGYTNLLQSFWSNGLFEDMDMRYLRLIDRAQGVAPFMAGDTLNAQAKAQVEERFRHYFNAGGARSYFSKMTGFDMKWLLPALLQVEDRVSMAVSLESRVPLLDHRVVDAVTRMSPRMRFRGGSSKRILRDAAQQHVPQAVLNRTDKMGFPMPLNQWLSREPTRSFVMDTLLSRAARQRGLWNIDALERHLQNGGGFSRGVWGLLCLELWHRTFIDRQFVGESVRRSGLGRIAPAAARAS